MRDWCSRGEKSEPSQPKEEQLHSSPRNRADSSNERTRLLSINYRRILLLLTGVLGSGVATANPSGEEEKKGKIDPYAFSVPANLPDASFTEPNSGDGGNDGDGPEQLERQRLLENYIAEKTIVLEALIKAKVHESLGISQNAFLIEYGGGFDAKKNSNLFRLLQKYLDTYPEEFESSVFKLLQFDVLGIAERLNLKIPKSFHLSLDEWGPHFQKIREKVFLKIRKKGTLSETRIAANLLLMYFRNAQRESPEARVTFKGKPILEHLEEVRGKDFKTTEKERVSALWDVYYEYRDAYLDEAREKGLLASADMTGSGYGENNPDLGQFSAFKDVVRKVDQALGKGNSLQSDAITALEAALSALQEGGTRLTLTEDERESEQEVSATGET